MELELASDWKEVLKEELKKPYFKKLMDFVKREYETQTCYPVFEDIFKAFNACAFEDLKVVILGQDPYHGKDQADGLCFSVREDVPLPRSLRNIFKEIEQDLNRDFPENGNLIRWAEQGVLLLNATLTVRGGQAGSHQRKGWEKFTDGVIEKISEEKNGVVFLLWGGQAQKKGAKINTDKHVVLTSGHPSPLSANRGYWFGNKHFSKTNAVLKAEGKKEIIW